MLREYLTNIANAIRAKLGTTDTINAQDFSTKVDEVYEQGRKDKYDEFWDAYQNNGTKTDYTNCFSGRSWNNNTFKPKYDIVVKDGYNMFFYSGISGHLNDRLNGKTLTVSNATRVTQMFSNSTLSGVGKIDISNTTTTDYIFGWAYGLKTIDELVVNENTKFVGIFNGSSGITKLNVTGTIGQNGFSVSACPKLTKPSIISIINALSTTTSGLKVTLSKTAVNNAFGINIDDPTTWAEGTEYYELRRSRDNWTITYV